MQYSRYIGLPSRLPIVPAPALDPTAAPLLLLLRRCCCFPSTPSCTAGGWAVHPEGGGRGAVCAAHQPEERGAECPARAAHQGGPGAAAHPRCACCCLPHACLPARSLAVVHGSLCLLSTAACVGCAATAAEWLCSLGLPCSIARLQSRRPSPRRSRCQLSTPTATATLATSSAAATSSPRLQRAPVSPPCPLLCRCAAAVLAQGRTF